VVGLQALSQYSIRTFSPSVDLKVSFTANDWHGQQLPLKNEKFKLQKIADKVLCIKLIFIQIVLRYYKE
jgi:hypothetical protein